MQAHLFYEFSTENSIPLYIISRSEWQNNQFQFTEHEKNYSSVKEFKGNLNEFCLICDAQGFIVKACVGSGDAGIEIAIATASLLLPANTYELKNQISPQSALFWSLAQYRFCKYKKDEVQSRRLALSNNILKELLPLANAHFMVRDLINTPASDMGPTELAHTVEQLALQFNAQFKQWIGQELLEHQFPAIHAVGRAAIQMPRLLSLIWGNEDHPKVTLVGKGVCFDTGGLDIKSAYGMRIMKKDMGGAAHVIGLAYWIMELQLPIRLHVIIPAVENAIGPDAFRPGDVVHMRNGLSVEVHNTDAEGRLTLADALTLACEEHPELIIDFATLTGAARVSVGTEMSALFSNNSELAQQIIEQANTSADPMWQLPLYKPYEDYLKSNIADMANASDHPYAGAIIAGLFLQRFVNPEIDWVHLDIMAWSDKIKPGKPDGGEAMGLRAIAKYLLHRYS